MNCGKVIVSASCLITAEPGQVKKKLTMGAADRQLWMKIGINHIQDKNHISTKGVLYGRK
jgi:hypothetical protein